MKISNRIESLASLVDYGSVVIDIGTDHAFLPIYLVEKGICRTVIASDNKIEPLNEAVKNIVAHGLQDKIKIILSDGLKAISDDFDTIIISGMGGFNIIEILDFTIIGKDKTLILEANNHQKELRQYLSDNSYQIIDEKLVLDRDHYYQIIKAFYSDEPFLYNEKELCFGPIIMKKQPSELKKMLNKDLKLLECGLKASSNKGPIKNKVLFIKEVIDETEETD